MWIEITGEKDTAQIFSKHTRHQQQKLMQRTYKEYKKQNLEKDITQSIFSQPTDATVVTRIRN